MDTPKQPTAETLASIGKVYLVGAGPGDPELLTLKGRRLLATAEVVVYDRLASPRLLEWCRPDAERLYAGKDPTDADESHTQDEINALLVERARAGKVVCRLKGGDPFVFGRGGEEAEVLVAAGIPWEYVPGVSSAIAVPGFAGIPVTHRGLGSSFTVITAHEDPSKGQTSVRWDLLAQGTDTLVILMGAERLGRVVEQLLEHGRPPETPAAVVSRGTFPVQRVVEGTLATIVERCRESGCAAPAVTVIGEVAALRERLGWWDRQPLFGKRIVVTRAREQASDLARLIEEAGGEAIFSPTIQVKPLEPVDLSSILGVDARPYDWVVFTSANGVASLAGALRNAGADLRRLAGAKLAAIGPGTAAALEALHLWVDFVPSRFVAEGVVEEFPEPVNGKRILIPRAREARELLPDTWRAQGADVNVVPVYETVANPGSVVAMRHRLAEGTLDAVTFTASSTVSNLLKYVEPAELAGVKVACIGPVTECTARQAGLRVDITAREHSIPGLVHALKQLFSH